MYTERYTNMQRQARSKEDQFQRGRFFAHNRAMTVAGQGARLAEHKAAAQENRNMSDADKTRWSSYVVRGGKAPTSSYGGGPAGPPEAAGPAPELNTPEYDESKVSALQQKRAAPNIRKLRNVTQQALSTSHENPNVQRMTVRDALAGYGTGLENVMGGAHKEATQEYGQQYAASVNAEMARFSAANARWSQKYDTSSKNWLMERQYQLEDQYDNEDPYDDFENFYA